MPKIAAALLMVLAALGAAISPAMPATVQRATVGTADPTVFVVTGEIDYGDDEAFIEEILRAKSGVVVFDSPGGNLDAAIQIGKAIRLKGFATLVLDGSFCASACALAWLSGQPRMMAVGAQIGFHAAYDVDAGVVRERGAANAIVGAYLAGLGLSPQAIYYATNSPPDGMQWLTFDDAGQIGIDVRRFELAPDNPTNSPSPEASTPPLPGRSVDAQTVPKFRDYQVPDLPVGTRAAVDLRAPEANMFRTRLRRAAQ